MHQVYIAGSYAARDRLRERAQQLMSRGVMVTSNWLWWEPADILMADKDRLDDVIWHMDWHGIITASLMIVDTDTESTKGGFNVEVGMAIAMRLTVIHIGPRPNAFYRAPNVKHFDSWEAFLTDIDRICKEAGDDFMQKMHAAEGGGISALPNANDIPAVILDIEKFMNEQRRQQEGNNNG